MPDPALPNWKRRLPNQLTCLRLVLAVVFILLLAPYSHGSEHGWTGSPVVPFVAAALFTIAALTDMLDGHLARKWGAVSVFGRVMDPFADKILVLGAFIVLAGPGLEVFWGTAMFAFESFGLPVFDDVISFGAFVTLFVVVMLARELLVTSLRGLVESRGGDFSATPSGKLKMIAQSIAIPAILVLVGLQAEEDRRVPVVSGDPFAPNPNAVFENVGGPAFIVLVLTTLITLWSAIPYITRAMKVLREPAKGA